MQVSDSNTDNKTSVFHVGEILGVLFDKDMIVTNISGNEDGPIIYYDPSAAGNLILARIHL